MTDKRISRGRLFRLAYPTLMLGAAITVPGHLHAQDSAPENEPVRERSRPEFDPLGIRYNNIFFYPSITIGEEYNDNIFAVDTGETSDFITTVSPELEVNSEGTRGGWRAGANGDFGFYADQSDENYYDASGIVGAYYNIVPDGELSADAGIARLHEDRSSPDDVGGIEPTVYYRALGRLGYSHRFNRLSAKADVTARDLTFSDVDAVGGAINNSDRDRLELDESLRLGYEFMPGYEAFTRGTLEQRLYDDAVDDGGVDRDSLGYRIEGGVTVEVTPLISLDVGLGYAVRDYDDPTLDTFGGFAATGTATWNVTRLTTVSATLSRDVEETTINGASGRVDTLGSVQIDHELLRNVIVSGNFRYVTSDFEGVARSDDRFDVGVQADYLLPFRGFTVSAKATHMQRNSNQAGADFDRNIVLLQLRYGF